jgi:hypothetical protein
MIKKAWLQITKEDVEALVADAVPESHTLDYKQEMPDESPKGKLDFLTDVVAFANASGGDLIFGVQERRVEGRPTAVPEGFQKLRVAGTFDEAMRRLESLIRTGVEPKLSVQIRTFEGLPEGPVVIVRIPQSLAAPHMITLYTKEHLRPQFHKRHNGGNHPMDVGEIRTAFVLSETRIDRLRRFRESRLSLIESQDPSVPQLSKTGVGYVLHLLPVTAFDPAAGVEISALEGRERDLVYGLSCGRVYGHFNFDGYLLNCYRDYTAGTLASSVQVFRNGAVESGKSLENGSYIGSDVEPWIIRRVRALLRVQRDLGVEPPIFLGVSFLRAKGCHIILPANAHYSGAQPGIDRDLLPLPECMIEDFDAPVERALRPAFDALYQSAGMPHSLNYNDQSDWIGERLD